MEGYVYVMSMSSKPKDEFPARLRAAREMRALKQDELAQRAGLQASAVSHFETGTRKPSFDNLRRLADALEVTTDYLIGRVKEATEAAPPAELFRKLGQLTTGDRDTIKMLVDQMAAKQKDKGR